MRSNGPEEALHNVTVSSSVGDITIDSVKDHLGSGEDLNRRISGMTVTKTVTTVVSSGQETVTSSSTTVTTTTNAMSEDSECRFVFCFVHFFCLIFVLVEGFDQGDEFFSKLLSSSRI